MARTFIEESVRIPAYVRDHGSFRRWAKSSSFPSGGRISWFGGEIVVDMGPEEISAHADPKAVIGAALVTFVYAQKLGRAWIDKTLYSNVEADLSCEPDVVVCFWDTLESGRVRLVPSTKRGYREVEGAADLVVEIVSPSSIIKDTKTLRASYHDAGVREYWIVDARGETLSFDLLGRRARGWIETAPDSKGFFSSAVLDRRVRLTRKPARLGLFDYKLDIRKK